MNGFPTNDFVALLPIAILTVGALAVLLSEVFLVSGRRGYQAGITVVFAAGAAASAVLRPVSGHVFGRQAVCDDFSAFVTVIVCAGLALSALVGTSWLRARNAERGEFYALALFGSAGMALLGMASDLLVAFIAIEVMSLATYSLAAYLRRGKRPSEAAFKYLVLGAISSALLLYGAALLYGATGSTLFAELPKGRGSPLYLAGLALVASGIAFKIAAVPFHAWTPDVYEGAPTPVTAFMAAGVKTAAFAFLARIFLSAEVGTAAQASAFSGILSGLAVLTMIFGNLLAVPQRSREADARVLLGGARRVPARRRRVRLGRGRAREGPRRDPLLPRRLRRHGDRRVRDRRCARASRAPRRRAGRSVGPRAVRRARPPPPGARVRDVGLPALARGHPAHRRLRREALHLPGGRRSAALRPRDPGRPDERDGRLLLPPRGRLHVHAAGRRRERGALRRPRCRSRSQRPWPSSCCSGSWRIRSYASRRRPAPSCCSPP